MFGRERAENYPAALEKRVLRQRHRKMKNNGFLFKGIKRGLIMLVACAVLAAACVPKVKIVFAESDPEEYSESETLEVYDTETPEETELDETPQPTEEETVVPETEIPTEEVTETPTPEPTAPPEYAEDGTQYLQCDSKYAKVTLDGTWTKEKKSIADFQYYDGSPSKYGENFTVPGIVCDGSEAILLEKNFYLTGFDPEESTVLLGFNRLMYNARIYVNGELIAEREYSYISEKLDITNYVLDGENALSIMLTSGENSVYKAGYGLGIDDSVTLESRRAVSIEKVLIDPIDEDGTVQMRVTAFMDKNLTTEEKLDVNVYELGIFENGKGAIHKGVGFAEETVLPNEKGKTVEVVLRVNLRDFNESKKWSPSNPFLYEADFTIDGISRKLVFGIRSVEINEDDIYVSLNGNQVFLAGITLDYKLLSELKVSTEAEIRSFITGIKKLGVNTIKGSGLVFSPTWYKVCDEAGILLISEYPLGLVVDGLDCATNAKSFARDISGFVETCYNYASCIVWDIAGEDLEVTNLDSVIKTIREYDKYNRPVSTGLTEPDGSGSLVECDVSQLGGDFFLRDFDEDEPLLHTTKELDWSIKEAKAARVVTLMFDNILSRRSDADFPSENDSWWKKTLKTLGTDDYQKGFEKILWVTIEYWRTSRKYGGIILPCEVVEAAISDAYFSDGLAGAAPEGYFNDGFKSVLKNGFSQIGVNIESYIATGGRGDSFAVSVALTNNTNEELETVEVVFTLSVGQKIVYQETKQYDSLSKLGASGRDIERHKFSFTVPKSIKDGTELVLSATIVGTGETISTRNTYIEGGDTYESPYSETAVIITVVAVGTVVLIAFVTSLVRIRAFNVKQKKQEKK